MIAHPVAPGGLASGSRQPAAETCRMCARAPVSAASRDDPLDRARSAAPGRESRNSRVRRAAPARRAAPGPRRARPAGRRTPAISVMRRPQLAGVERRELLHARRRQEALEAVAPRLVQRPQVLDVAGDRAAPEADVDVALPGGGRAAWPPARPRSTVGGSELSGMSTIVVTPPAAAALVAVAKPSQWVRPGSLTCTWVSTRPGSSATSAQVDVLGRRRARRRRRAARRSGRRGRRRPAGRSPPAVTVLRDG